MTERRTPRRILCNDDGWIMGEFESPVTVADLKRRMVDTYRDSPVDALMWCVGNNNVCGYETRVGEMFGEGFETFEDELDRRHAENIRGLIDECGGPLTALTRLCHEAGMDIFPSMRMNSHYAGDPASPSFGKIRREHPELLIGRPGEEHATGTLEWGIRSGVDYARPEVRQHMAAVLGELIESFDVDGLELDFMRHPAFFRVDEAYDNRRLMTDLMGDVKGRMRDAAQAKGRSLDLAVRVPPTLADSARLGLDVATWMSEGLVDIVIAGGGFIPFEVPMEEFVEAAQGTDCLVYGGIEHLRPAVDEDVVRAIASRFWSAGASGIHLFNYFGKTAEWKRRVLGQIADPDVLARQDKRYHMDATDRLTTRDQHDHPFRYAVPPVQLPVTLPYTLAGGGPVLNLMIADDVAVAQGEGALSRCVLKLSFDDLKGEDDLEVWLNREQLSSGSSRVSFGPWTRLEWTEFPTRLEEAVHTGGTIEIDLECPPLAQGRNELEVRLVKRTVQQPRPLVLRDVEVTLGYDRA